MNETRGFKGVWIPAELWLDENLSKMEMLFLTEIDSLDNENGCFASNEHFEKWARLSKSRCSEIISSLKIKKYITIEYEYEGKEITKRIIRVLTKYKKSAPLRKTEHQNRTTPSENRTTPSENTKDINTFNNTDTIKKSDDFFAELENQENLPSPKKPDELDEFIDFWNITMNQNIIIQKKDRGPLYGIIKSQTLKRLKNATLQAKKANDNPKGVKYTFGSIVYKASNIAALSAQFEADDPHKDLPEEVRQALKELQAKENKK